MHLKHFEGTQCTGMIKSLLHMHDMQMLLTSYMNDYSWNAHTKAHVRNALRLASAVKLT